MLLQINYQDKNLSIYECDRCKTTLDNNNRKAIYVSLADNTCKKKWDLCERCYRAFGRAIKRGV